MPEDHPDTLALAEMPADIYCPGCSYNLRGSIGERCPECGYSLAEMRSDVCRIPWVRRRELGRCYTFWRTVWMVTFRNRRFCEEYARPVSFPDARAFQWVTLVHVYLPVLLAVGLVYLTVPPVPEAPAARQLMMLAGMPGAGPTLFDRAYAEVWPTAIQLICFLLFLAASTGVPSYFFHPRAVSVQRQNSGLAMSYYACGPLALAGLPIIAVGAAAGQVSALCWHGVSCLVVGGLASALIVLAWWLNLVHLSRRTTPQLRARAAVTAICVPVLWLLVAGLTLLALPLCVLFVLVVIASSI